LLQRLRRIPFLFVFLVSCLFFANPSLDDYTPGVKVRPETTVVVSPEREPKRDLDSAILAIIAGERLTFTAVFIYSFVKFDRKQNIRLWPFVTMGTPRAPPAGFSL